MEKITLDTPLKFLRAGGCPTHGIGTWHLPTSDSPGAWMPHINNIELCERGYHWCYARDALTWLNAECYLIEPSAHTIHSKNKSVSSTARLLRRVSTWNDKTARLFAVDCAETVAHLNPDPRVAAAIIAARQFAFGVLTSSQLEAAGAAAGAAAGEAAWEAAREAAGAAAREAAWEAQTQRLLQYLNAEV